MANYAAMTAALSSGTQPTLYDPAASTLKALTTVDAIAGHLKLDDALRGALFEALGCKADHPPEEFGMLPQDVFNEVLRDLKVNEQPLTPLARSHAGMMGRYFRLIAGVEKTAASEPVTPPLPTETSAGHPPLEPAVPRS